MKASLRWLRELADLPSDLAEASRRLTMAGYVVASATPCGDDVTLDVEVTYNRPDLLCHVGLARELAGLFGSALREPDASVPPALALPDAVPVTVEAGDLCPVYTGRVVRGVRVAPSPAWLVARLEAAGQRSVNGVVDVTNLVMLETGQPLHAFDLAKLRGPRIVVRRARGEAFTAIDGSRLEVGADDLAICDAASPAALAGVMGGLATEVSAATTDVLLESAIFSPLAIRATSRRHGIRSESSFRFERHVDPCGVVRASDRAARLLAEVCGATGVGPVVAEGPGVAAGAVAVPARAPIVLRTARASLVLGLAVEEREIRAILASLGLREAPGAPSGAPAGAPAGATAWTPPSWRPDLAEEIDLVEEVGRRVGFDRIPDRTSLAVRPRTADPRRAAARRIRDALVAEGVRECISAPFVGEGPHDVALLVAKPALRVENPMRADECLLRRSLVGPLLATARRNRERDVPHVRIFEQAPVYVAGDRDGACEELHLVAGVVSGTYADAKGCAEAVLAALGLERDAEFAAGAPKPLRADRSATIRVGGEVVGVAGELTPRAAERLGLGGPTAVFELRADRLAAAAVLERPYRTISRFPAVERDVAWVVADGVTWRRIEDAVRAAGGALVRTVTHLNEFRGAQLGPGRRSVAFRMELRADDRTLTGDEADACVRLVLGRLAADTGGSLRA